MDIFYELRCILITSTMCIGLHLIDFARFGTSD